MSACLFFLHAISPLHMGAGVADGAIDLPHARDVATGHPIVPGSGIKGVLRDELPASNFDPGVHKALFGANPEDTEDTRDQGALMFSDGRLLCLPVRSYFGTFAWVTCPSVLMRASEEYAACGMGVLGEIQNLANMGTDQCAISSTSVLVTADDVFLQDLKLIAQPDNTAHAVTIASSLAKLIFSEKAWQEAFAARFLVASDAVFGHLCQYAMDVRPRVRLKDEAKTVVKGGLWYEENLPAESLLWGTVAADPMRDPADRNKIVLKEKMLEQLMAKKEDLARIQMGGKATVGRGIMRCVLVHPQTMIAGNQ